MAKLKQTIESIRQKDLPMIVKELDELRAAWQKARVDLAFGRLPNISFIRETRKQIARLETIKRQKEIEHV